MSSDGTSSACHKRQSSLAGSVTPMTYSCTERGPSFKPDSGRGRDTFQTQARRHPECCHGSRQTDSVSHFRRIHGDGLHFSTASVVDQIRELFRPIDFGLRPCR